MAISTESRKIDENPLNVKARLTQIGIDIQDPDAWPDIQSGSLNPNHSLAHVFDTAVNYLKNKNDEAASKFLQQAEGSYSVKHADVNKALTGRTTSSDAEWNHLSIDDAASKLVENQNRIYHRLVNPECRDLLRENKQLKQQLARSQQEKTPEKPKARQWISLPPCKTKKKWSFQRVKPYQRPVSWNI